MSGRAKAIKSSTNMLHIRHSSNLAFDLIEGQSRTGEFANSEIKLVLAFCEDL